MSLSTIKTSVYAALNAAKSYAAAIEELQGAFKGKPADDVRIGLLPYVAEFYSVSVLNGEGKSKGKKVLDSDAPKYEAAKKALQRLVKDIVGGSSGKAEEIEIPAELLAAAAKLAKLANEYEGARSLAAKALAAAFAK